MDRYNSQYTMPALTPELEQGPTWLRERRQTSRDSFNKSGLPKRGLHLWRYTDPVKFMYQGSGDRIKDDPDKHRTTVFEPESTLTAGLIVLPLAQAVASHAELVRQYLYELVNNQTGKFEAMNSALWNDGVFVFVPDNTTVEQPIHLRREGGNDIDAHFPRLLVIVGKNSRVTLIDEYGGGSNGTEAGLPYVNAAVEIFGMENSHTQYVSLQRHGSTAHAYTTHRARMGRDASMLTIPLVFGAALSKQNFGVTLAEPGAESTMRGLAFGAGRQHLDNHTLHHHAAGQTRSRIDFKVVLRDKAISTYTGLIRIENDASACEAYQENRNLLLDKGTRAEAIPELEILNEDVSCSHGATVGPVDPNMLFYLICRGIPYNQAVRIIVSGFTESTLTQIPEDLRERVAGFVADSLEDI